MSDGQELKYPCVAKRADGTLDYGAVEDGGAVVEVDEQARNLSTRCVPLPRGSTGPQNLRTSTQRCSSF